LGPGGKERRLSQLVLSLLAIGNCEIKIIVTSNKLHYSEILNDKVSIHHIEKSPRNLFGIMQFWKIAADFKPHIIHTWGGLITLIAIPFALFKRTPLINGQVTANSKVSLIDLIVFYHLPFLFSNVIVTNTKRAIMEYRIPKRKVQCIYNGFDFNRLSNLGDKHEIRNQLGIKTQYVVGMVASFVPLKDYKTYIEAALNVLHQKREVTFLAIGSGNSSEYVKMIPNQLQNKFIFMTAQKKIEDIMNICDIGVLATLSEGMPNVLLEFMALGKPVIATDVGGIPELITHEVNGLLFFKQSTTELTEHIMTLLKSNNKRQYLGDNAVKTIKNCFSFKKMTEEYVKIYKKFSAITC